MKVGGHNFYIRKSGAGLISAHLKDDEFFKPRHAYAAVPRSIVLLNDLKAVAGMLGYPLRKEWDEFSPSERRFTHKVIPPNVLSVTKDLPKFELNSEDFDSYAEALRQMIEDIIAFKPDLILVPERGAIRPWMHLSVPTQMIDKGHRFPYTGLQQANAGHALRERLMPHQSSDAKILILDTADSGDGCRNLLKTLIDSHRGSTIWTIQCSLLFGKMHIPEQCWNMPHEMSTATLDTTFKPQVCTRLIGEDEPDQIPSNKAGDAVVILHHSHTTDKLWVPNVALFLDSLISASLHTGYQAIFQIIAPLSQVAESNLPRGLVITD
jgi:hypothetical protein